MASTSTSRFSTAALSVCLLVLLATQSCEGAPSCSDNGVVREVATETSCTNGLVTDWCNREVCGKGPGETCGGRWNEHGLCGRGMFCGCGICHGCNKRLQCYFNAKC